MRLTWGLNPLANEFEPGAAGRRGGSSKQPLAKTGVLYQALKSTGAGSHQSPAVNLSQRPVAPIPPVATMPPPQICNPRPNQLPVQQRHIVPPMQPQMPFQTPPPLWAPRGPVGPMPPQPVAYNGGYYSGSPIPSQNHVRFLRTN